MRDLQTGIGWNEIEYLVSCEERSSPRINTSYQLVTYVEKILSFCNMEIDSQKIILYSQKRFILKFCIYYAIVVLKICNVNLFDV